MTVNLEYVSEEGWPPLAWLAKCRPGTDQVYLHHGSGVETRAHWFCEAVWAGEFEGGDFDKTDLIYGSGGRLRSGKLVFISSGATVDRLQFLTVENEILVSNSLACIKAHSTGWPDKCFSQYRQFFYSIGEGIDRYGKKIPGKGPELVYYHNLSWDGLKIEEVEKPAQVTPFTTFESYLAFLQSSLERLGNNLASPSRKKCLTPIGTISSGYDSATASALARSAGLRRVFTFAKAREEIDDDGSAIAEHLGLKVDVLDRTAWQSDQMNELPFFAADAEGGELPFAGASHLLNDTVLFTGNHGDKIWDKNPEVPINSRIIGGGASGLSLTEYRLMVGMIHVPVPYIGVTRMADIVDISRSPEMRNCDLGNNYNRPFCRKVLEDAGVPRHLFGMKKKATASLFRHGDVFLTRKSRIGLANWLARNQVECRNSAPRRSAMQLILRYFFVPEIVSYTEKAARKLFRILPSAFRCGLEWRLTKLRCLLNKQVNIDVQWAFPWALEELSNSYKNRPN